MGQPLSKKIEKTDGKKKSNLVEVDRSFREELDCVKAKLYINALNDECIPIVCAVDKFEDMRFINNASEDFKESVSSIIKDHLKMGDGAHEEIIELVFGRLLNGLSQSKKVGIYKKDHTHVVYANKAFIRVDYFIHLENLNRKVEDGNDGTYSTDGTDDFVLFYYGQVGLMEVAKARLPVLIYELIRATGDRHLKTASDALEKLGNLKLSSVEDAVSFLRGKAQASGSTDPTPDFQRRTASLSDPS